MIQELINLLKTFPEYIPAVWAAGTVLAMAAPMYLALWYFLARRKLAFRWGLRLSFLGVFVLFAGLAFLMASPLSRLLHPAWIQAALFVTLTSAAYVFVGLIDTFLIEHYLIRQAKIYISPPLRKVLNLILFVIAFLFVLRWSLRFNPLALVAIPTILTAGVALALQDTLKTFIAGIGLGQMLRMGEWISFQGKEGQVVDINWARTVLLTEDGDYLFIPNSQLQTQSFVNFTTQNPLHHMTFKVGVAYEASPSEVKQAMLQVAHHVKGVAPHPEPFVLMAEFGEFALSYVLHYWVNDYATRGLVADQIATGIWYAFRQDAIEIPRPSQVLHLKRWKPQETATPLPSEKVLHALGRWELAQVFSGDDLEELARWVRSRSFQMGDQIVKQGDPGYSLFIILEGSVEVLAKDGDQSPVLAVLGKDQFFGEMSLLTGAPRSTTVRAASPVEVLEIEKAGLQKILAKRPALSEKLANLVAQRQGDLTAHQPQASGVEHPGPSGKPLAHRIREFFGL